MQEPGLAAKGKKNRKEKARRFFLRVERGRIGSPFVAAVVIIIRLYQKMISPLLPPSCRFYPTCSEYACQAFLRYGLLKGFFLASWRLLRCHPFSPGGYDPLK